MARQAFLNGLDWSVTEGRRIGPLGKAISSHSSPSARCSYRTLSMRPPSGSEKSVPWHDFCHKVVLVSREPVPRLICEIWTPELRAESSNELDYVGDSDFASSEDGLAVPFLILQPTSFMFSGHPLWNTGLYTAEGPTARDRTGKRRMLFYATGS